MEFEYTKYLELKVKITKFAKQEINKENIEMLILLLIKQRSYKMLPSPNRWLALAYRPLIHLFDLTSRTEPMISDCELFD